MKKLMLTAALCGASAVYAAPAMAACQRSPASYDMPAQRLDAATQQLAHVSGCPVVFDQTMVADRRAPALKGRYTPEQALARLVRGTGYVAYTTPEGLAFDSSMLDVAMSEVRVLRTAIDSKARDRTISPAQALRLRTTVAGVEKTLPRLVNTQGMVTSAQKTQAVTALQTVRSAVGPVDDATGWAAFSAR